jgi:hypothetical protein
MRGARGENEALDAPVLVRPNFSAFNPRELNPRQFAWLRRHLNEGPGYVGEPPYKILPIDELGPAVPLELEPPGILERIINWIGDRLPGADSEKGDLPSAHGNAATMRDHYLGTVWGLWAGLIHSGDQETDVFVRDLSTLTEQARGGERLKLPHCARLMSRLPGEALEESRARPTVTDPLGFLRPALPPLGLLRAVLLPVGYPEALVAQAILAIPWAQLSGMEFHESDGQARLGVLAPLLDGLLASAYFCQFLEYLAPVRESTDWEQIEYVWTSLSAMNYDDYCGAENGKGLWVNRRLRDNVLSRAAPLTKPLSCQDALHTALWAHLTATSFSEVFGALTSIAADAVAFAAAGAMAGARWGWSRIPKELLEKIPDQQSIQLLAETYTNECQVGRRWTADQYTQYLPTSSERG